VDLPKEYIRIAHDITNYWGAYPPSYPLSPGLIGRSKDGAFVHEDHLRNFPRYDPVAHAVEENAVSSDPVTVWTTQRVSMKVLGADVATPLAPVSGKIQIHFGAKNEAAIICKGNLYRSFSSQRAVKDLILYLDENKQWDRKQCVVTEVLVAKAVWVFFATSKDQTAEVEGSAPLDPSKFAVPVDALKELAGKANLVASFSGSRSAGITASLPDGGTPLFRAIQLKKSFMRNHTTIDYVMGPDLAFEGPTFGEVESS